MNTAIFNMATMEVKHLTDEEAKLVVYSDLAVANSLRRYITEGMKYKK